MNRNKITPFTRVTYQDIFVYAPQNIKMNYNSEMICILNVL